MSEPDFTIPPWIRWRPLPAPFDVTSSTLPIVSVTPKTPEPCRRCLQDSIVGEEMILMSYDPFLADSPFRSSSPIFLHARSSCGIKDALPKGAQMPDQQRVRPLSIRAFDSNHMMIRAELAEGIEVLELCKQLLSENEVEYLHLHYARHGCFAVKVERAVGH